MEVEPLHKALCVGVAGAVKVCVKLKFYALRYKWGFEIKMYVVRMSYRILKWEGGGIWWRVPPAPKDLNSEMNSGGF